MSAMPKEPMSVSSRRADERKRLAAIAVAAILILVAVGYAVKSGGSASFTDQPDAYHAVFLSNGQVYFSKVASSEKGFVKLNDIYYLRVQKTLQPKPEAASEQQEQTSVSLVKLGNELHGPQDVMMVNRDHVLFVEPLKEDSNVVQAIKNDKESKKESQ